MFARRIFITILAILFIFAVGILFAQEFPEEGFNWASLGVNVGIIGAIIAIVQIFKKYIPVKFVVFAPIVLSVAAFFVMGGDQPTENVLYWAAAAGYLWKIANKITPDGILKTKAELE